MRRGRRTVEVIVKRWAVMSMVLISGCVSPRTRAEAPVWDGQLAVANPLSAAALAGCYRLHGAGGAVFQRGLDFWAAPVKLDTTRVVAAYARNMGEPEVFRFSSTRPRPPAESILFSPAWYIHGPDSLFLVRIGPSGGERLALEAREGRLAGEWTSSDDAIAAAVPPRISVELRRTNCAVSLESR